MTNDSLLKEHFDKIMELKDMGIKMYNEDLIAIFFCKSLCLFEKFVNFLSIGTYVTTLEEVKLPL